jgi:hypothetical protein
MAGLRLCSKWLGVILTMRGAKTQPGGRLDGPRPFSLLRSFSLPESQTGRLFIALLWLDPDPPNLDSRVCKNANQVNDRMTLMAFLLQQTAEVKYSACLPPVAIERR